MTMASSTTKPVEMVKRHQGEVVEAVAEQIHHAEGADERNRDGHAGNDGGAEAAQEKEDDQDDQADGQHQLKFDVADGGLNAGGEVGERNDLDRGGKVGLELRQYFLDAVDDFDGVGAGLPLDVEDDGGRLVHPSGLASCFPCR